MLVPTIPLSGPRRDRLLCVQERAESIALVEHLLAGHKDLELLRSLDLEHGLELARAKHPEVILIDLDLPGMGGLEFMKRLRADPATEATPILALGSNTSTSALTKAREAGFFHYFAKPLPASTFLEALAHALEFSAIERSERAGPQPLKESR